VPPALRSHHVGLTVDSLDVSVAFYRDVLGLELVMRWNPRAPYVGVLVGYQDVDLHAAVLRLPGTDVCLELLEYRGVARAHNDMGNGNPGTSHLAFYVDDVAAAHRDLVARGVPAVSEPVTPTMGPNRGGRAVYLIDPDGFRIELIETSGSFSDYARETDTR
jgi:catechol 2,3-dioxygenase-like lactoylglutathione lyase family enzyme